MKSTKPMKNRMPHRHKQGGFALENFLLWMILAAMAIVITIQTYSVGSAKLNSFAVVSAVNSIKAGAESVKTINNTGVSMARLCGTTRNAVPMKICGASRDGTLTNPYGGNYTVIANDANLQLVDIAITQVDNQYIDGLADALAPYTAANCTQATGCAGITVADNTITVTM
ncbi:hypothetical protein [Vibrio pectenicida]|uniref:Type 4 secretion system PilS N-terminal domain-containing protein n=1 Tax=Vibrio pectenicida TaxID=62763 RepID=A0A3R9FMW4_9VIBR|nr:hypothetical protein [Vibrio pectenicida]RSD31736.1 hypothetical protein EJA03_07365 [Vibrio pectenicida]